MSAKDFRLRSYPDELLAVAAVGLLGSAVAVALALQVSGRTEAAVPFAAAALAALVVLLAAGWLSPLAMVVLSLPLPAVLSADAARVAPAAIITFAVLMAWVVNRTSRREPIELGAAPIVPALALFLAVAFAGIFAARPLLAARELFSWILLLGLLFAATDLFVERRSRIMTFLRLQSVVAGCVGVLAVLQMIGIFPAEFQLDRTALNRASLGFQQPNGLGMLFAISLPLAIHVARQTASQRQRLLAWACVASCGLGLISTFSRGSWLAFLGSTVLLALAGQRKLALKIAICSTVAAAAVDFASGGAVVDRIVRTAQDGMVLQRLASTYAGLVMVQENPLVGVGPGGFAEALEVYGPGVTILSEYVGSAHNGYVQMAAETGLLGLVGLLLFMGAGFRILWWGARGEGPAASLDTEGRGLSRCLLWSFGVFCLLGFVEWPLSHGIGELVMLLMAAGASLQRVNVPGDSQDWARLRR